MSISLTSVPTARAWRTDTFRFAVLRVPHAFGAPVAGFMIRLSGPSACPSRRRRPSLENYDGGVDCYPGDDFFLCELGGLRRRFNHADEQLGATCTHAEQAISVFQRSTGRLPASMQSSAIFRTRRSRHPNGYSRNAIVHQGRLDRGTEADLQAADRGCGGAEIPPGSRRRLTRMAFSGAKASALAGSGRHPMQANAGKKKAKCSSCEGKADQTGRQTSAVLALRRHRFQTRSSSPGTTRRQYAAARSDRARASGS